MKSASYPVIEEAFQLSVWIAGCVERMPRSHKFTIGDRLHTKLLELIDTLILAAYTKGRVEHLRQANLLLEQARYLLRMAHELRLVDERKYEYGAKAVNSIGRGVGGWLKANAQAPRPPIRQDRELSGTAPRGAAGDTGQA